MNIDIAVKSLLGGGTLRTVWRVAGVAAVSAVRQVHGLPAPPCPAEHEVAGRVLGRRWCSSSRFVREKETFRAEGAEFAEEIGHEKAQDAQKGLERSGGGDASGRACGRGGTGALRREGAFHAPGR